MDWESSRTSFDRIEDAIRLREEKARSTSMKKPLWERLPAELPCLIDELIADDKMQVIVAMST